jgi:hypothetical protein
MTTITDNSEKSPNVDTPADRARAIVDNAKSVYPPMALSISAQLSADLVSAIAAALEAEGEDLSRERVAELEYLEKISAEADEMEKSETLSGYWHMFDKLVTEKGRSAAWANAFTVARATFDLTQRGFLKDARIAELEASRGRVAELEAQVAELTLEADRHVEEITHLRNEGKGGREAAGAASNSSGTFGAED